MKKNQYVRIYGSKVVLVPYRKCHVQRYHDWMTSKELQELTASESLSLEEEYQMQQKWLQDDDKCTFIILDATAFSTTNDETASMIGDTNLFFRSSDDYSLAEIEIMIAEHKHRGKGFGKQALQLMLRYAVDVLEVQSFEAKINKSNIVSRKLFEQIGFEKSGENAIFNEVILSLTASDSWRQQLHECTNYQEMRVEPLSDSS